MSSHPGVGVRCPPMSALETTHPAAEVVELHPDQKPCKRCGGPADVHRGRWAHTCAGCRPALVEEARASGDRAFRALPTIEAQRTTPVSSAFLAVAREARKVPRTPRVELDPNEGKRPGKIPTIEAAVADLAENALEVQEQLIRVEAARRAARDAERELEPLARDFVANLDRCRNALLAEMRRAR